MKIFYTILLNLLILNINAQEIIIKGTINDEKSALPGADVSIYDEYAKDKKKKTVLTDFDGNFEIKIRKEDKIVFSFPGYKELTYVPKKNLTMTVILGQMKSYVKSIEEEKKAVDTVKESNESYGNIEEIKEEEEIVEDVPYSIIEEAPVFPGCLGTNAEKKACLNRKIRKHVARHFNADLGNCLEEVKVYNIEKEEYEYECKESLPMGKKRIFVQFKIDKDGSIINISAKGPHPKLEQEAIRITKKLPKMKPGKQRGKPVRVGYTLPITFNVE